MGECLANIPYASVIAFVLVLIGGCVMTGTLYEAVRQTDVYFRSTFYPIEELLYVQIASVVVSPVTVVLAVILLTFGILATGATRNKIYRGDRCILGGRFSAGLFMAFSYLISLVWVGIACFLMIPIVGYIMMDKVCYEEWTYWRDIDGEKTNAKFFTYFKFNLTHYGLYKKLYTFRPELKFNETITTATAFQNFCSKIGTIGPLYAFAWAGAVFVIFGLMCFIGALSANFTKLKYTKELTDYRAAGEFLAGADAELLEMLHEVHSSSWAGDRVHQFDISGTAQAGGELQCAVLAAKRLHPDQFLVFIGGLGVGRSQCFLASRSGAVCRRLMPPTEASPCCTRVFVTSLSGCLISVQRRVDDSTSFNRSWAEYAAGFGPGPHSNHWIGLRSLNSLTWPSGRQLRIRMRLWNDMEYWANYSSFSVDSEDSKFQVSISGFSGSSGLGDCMAICNGMKFSTFDSDNDINPGSCSASYKGGWWYGTCHCTNPNGLYFYSPTALNTAPAYAKSVCWSNPFGYYYSMKEFEMLLL